MSLQAYLVDAESERRQIRDGMTIGREGCDLSVSDAQISRNHARLRIVGANLTIEDLGSRNGTYLNERRIDSPTTISAGDSVRIGQVVWRVEVGRSPPAEPAEGAGYPGAGRGDVPPPGTTPSAVRRVAVLQSAPDFPEAPPSRRPLRGSAARIDAATYIAFAIVLVTAAAVIVYLAAR